jgi:DNA polymerase I-like protein with 3'-5' exonuclease and polymerase domains
LIKREMEGVIVLSVPLTVECESGTNWLEAH